MEHNNGKETSTKRYVPWELLYYEAYKNETLARLREQKLKHHGSALRELKRRIGILGRREKSGAGFTLIEIMAVVSIMIILLGIVLVNYKSFGDQFALQRSANRLAQDIRRAQEMAMSAKECPAGVLDCPVGQVPSGYGVYIEAGLSIDIYILYADTSSSNGNEFYTSSDAEVEYPQLEKGIIIKDINTTPKKVGINFRPPDPVIKIKFPIVGSSSDVDEVIITLAIKTDINRIKTITVNKAGLVEIK